MNKEARFDHIVGLIYETAQSAQGPDTIIDAISSEIDTISSAAVGSNSKREWVREFIFHTASSDWACGHGGWDTSSRSKDRPKAPNEPLDGHDRKASQLLRRLATHLRRSISMRQRIRSLEEQQAIRHVELNNVPFGLVWVGHDLKVVSVNARGDDILKMQDGLAVRDARLHTWIAADLDRLESALKAAMRSDDRRNHLLAIRRRANTLPLLASVIPAIVSPNNTPLPLGPLALVILQNPDQNNFDLGHLQLIYGFTAAERALAEALLRNETVESFADVASVSRNTVRTHLAKLFAKTGTSRQAELVRLLLLARPMT